MSRSLKTAKVPELEPLYLSLDDAARFSGIAKKTLQNRFSRGDLPIKVRYHGSKPLIELKSLREYLRSLPSESPNKRGRKRTSGSLVDARATIAREVDDGSL